MPQPSISRRVFASMLPLRVAGIALLAAVLTGVGFRSASGQDAKPTPQPGIRSGLATVESFTINPLNSDPRHLSLTVRGHVPDPCTRIARAEQEIEGRTIRISVFTERSEKTMCIQVVTPFLKTFPLDLRDLPPGQYRVEVNGVRKTFMLKPPPN